MGQIKVSELFYSIQGEGKHQGVPSVFLRTFGCNFTCDGFGMPKGQLSNERKTISELISSYKDYKSLPLTSTGCDTYAAWDPNFKHLSPLLDTNAIADRISVLLPTGDWMDEHLVITGGEPLLGWQRSYPELLDNPKMQKLKELTFETNGTQKLTSEFKQYLLSWGIENRGYNSLTFSVSPKLSVSGEQREDAIRPEVVCDYQNVGSTYLKIVIANEEDAKEALEVIDIYRKHGFNGPVYFMPMGGTEKTYHMNNRTVAELAMKHGIRYSDRLHIPLFKNAWGT